LRIAAGRSVRGLGGIAPRSGPLLRPLLEVSGSELRAAADAIVPTPAEDPTNLDRSVPRNRLRLDLLPRLERTEPELRRCLAALPARARRASERLDARIAERVHLNANPAGEPWVLRRELVALPAPLWPRALALLVERSGSRPGPGPARLRSALEALAAGTRFELRLGPLRIWGGSERIGVRRRESPGEGVSYTVSLPGEVELRELGLRMRITRERVAPWMFQGRRDRAAFDLPAGVVTAEVRRRRPGDRIRPLGSRGERKLKELLIDRKVPRELRSELPLLVVGGRIVWVPGVTIDEDFRLREGPEAWMAALEPLATTVPGGNGRLSDEVGASERETT
ncbi:MAG: tRNA lysidine(34) synthetase TilS, partial [Holophagales bacterium]|nr:tRNA lysidine(34) synthetase TilS [Holophagales bacterium]